jgi:hypothetical protein
MKWRTRSTLYYYSEYIHYTEYDVKNVYIYLCIHRYFIRSCTPKMPKAGLVVCAFRLAIACLTIKITTTTLPCLPNQKKI